MIKFEKVSFEQFKTDVSKIYAGVDDEYIEWCYANIKLPKRSTKGSAGYDFFMPFVLRIRQGSGTEEADYTTIPTGIRWVTDRDDVVLMLFPRSGFGFKNGMYLANTVGIIDSDYAQSSNEGHIMVKVSNHIKPIDLETGRAFVQGIILPYITTTDEEEVTTVRDGGFGSTDQNGR